MARTRQLVRRAERQEQSYFGPNPRFGLLGSITTESECAAAGGKFYLNLFGWMVHLDPFES